MLNSRSRSKSRSTRRRSAGTGLRALKPQRRRAKRSRFDTTVQAVRVRWMGGSRGSGLGGGRSVRQEGGSHAKSRSQRGLWSRGTAPGRGERRDPRVPRFQGLNEQRGYRAGSHAMRARGARLSSALPWVAAIPLNGKTVFNVVILALLGWALVWLSTSERFYVQQVVTSGNSRVSSEVLRQVSGLEGYSVFWVNPKRVADQILETLPPIESVQVRYGFVDQSGLAAWVKLDVQEHSDEIVWQVAGQRYWVDRDGELREVRGPGAAVVDAGTAADSEVEVGQMPEGPRLLIRDMRPSRPTQVDLEALSGARQLVYLLPEVRVLEYAPGTGLRFEHPRGWLVYLGTGSDMPGKVGVLRALEVEFAGEGVVQPTLVDLRFPDSPYYRLPDDNDPEEAD